ncbi:MAG: thiolase family protein [Burkholderiaceae bacterium]|nr:thiolase family protein [Burkholderiaceae bacterium]
MSDVYVVGVGMTSFGRLKERSIQDLTRDAADAALRDAGCDYKAIQIVLLANSSLFALERSPLVAGVTALREMGFEHVPIVETGHDRVSASTAFKLAHGQVRSGEVDIVLAVGAAKRHNDVEAKVFEIFDAEWDAGSVESLHALTKGSEPPAGERQRDPGFRSAFMEAQAALARAHMKRFGTTVIQIAAVAKKNHLHSILNPLTQNRYALLVDEVVKAQLVAWPLTLPMCAQDSEGAAAAVLCSSRVMNRFARARAVKVAACVQASGGSRDPADVRRHVCHRAAGSAYEQAGVGPGDIDVAEVYDSTAFAEIVQAENLGFCDFGDGGKLAERGVTALGGRIPINPSGGLESNGYAIGATGLAQVFELVTHLRREAGARQVGGARLAISQNSAGSCGLEEASTCVTILQR